MVHVLLQTGSVFVEGVESPFSLMAASKGRVRRGRGRVDGGRCARLLQDRRAPGRVLQRARASGRAQRAGREHGQRHAQRRRRQARLGHAGLRAVARGARLARTSLPRKAWWWWSRCSTTSPPTTRSSSPAAAWRRSARAMWSPARSVIAGRCSATPATCPRRCGRAMSSRCSTSAACSACATRSTRTRASRSTAGCSAWR